ncbi:MAG: 16S rRNA (adenine(1518)-N(6)/adenine(1519)-N(6))-dimethyltransferase RsmA [Candidatus Omnitrophica bacterium]|jgi:16S rRNA (adenine1518-N6/adenine1519-N6)-dimethyltransferase|nr:16S rRNA (adenine(1518)-N(6)/adenine(1519)-N(6))-dimethyltransferase RsmA [Candidatus Omnitrophota bacterium]
MHAKPKKSLGQNFLVDKNIRAKIVSACSFMPEDILFEVGSGRGELTLLFSTQVKKLFSVEIDSRLYDDLQVKLSSCSNCLLVKADILKINLAQFLAEQKVSKKIKIFGNIPYYISSPLIEYFINYRDLIDEIFITVQKEYAQRLVASAGSKAYGSLSCFAQYYLQAKPLFHISKNSFYPAPKVDSSFLSLKPRSKKNYLVCDEQLFFKIIRGAFNQRRKTLRNSLEDIVPQGVLEGFLKQAGLDKNIRPESLNLGEFAALSNYMKKMIKKG